MTFVEENLDKLRFDINIDGFQFPGLIVALFVVVQRKISEFFKFLIF